MGREKLCRVLAREGGAREGEAEGGGLGGDVEEEDEEELGALREVVERELEERERV